MPKNLNCRICYGYCVFENVYWEEFSAPDIWQPVLSDCTRQFASSGFENARINASLDISYYNICRQLLSVSHLTDSAIFKVELNTMKKDSNLRKSFLTGKEDLSTWQDLQATKE